MPEQMRSALVIGSGIAGLVAALKLTATHQTTLVTKAALAESNTLYAQGGIAAVLPEGRGTAVGTVEVDDGELDSGELDSTELDSTELDSTELDSTEAHILDTLQAGAGLNDYAAVHALCAEGPELIRELIDIGVAFDRTSGRLDRGLEAAHSHPRVLHAGGDATGAAIERALIAAVCASSCQIVQGAFLADLVVDDGRVVGADIVLADGRLSRYDADAVIVATGGAGQLYRHTTNPSVTTGDGIAAAWRAGAELTDLEFFQFHPTTLAIPGNFLVSEAVRGEGAVLINAAGERFMLSVHPDAELAPRDVVARAIAVEMAAQGGAPVRLDATALGFAFLARRFPTIDAATRAAGFDWGHEAIPVTPAAHYWMGGVTTDVNGRTTLPGLYAIGEAACTGVHGANRLASNSLLEGLVFADRAARDIAHDHASGSRVASLRAHQDHATGLGAVSPRSFTTDGSRASAGACDRTQLQRLMWDAAGVLRSRETLERAAETLAVWRQVDSADATIAQREDANLLDLARLVIDAALARDESRGAHYRSDFPTLSPDFAHHMPMARHLPLGRQGALAC